MSHYNWDFWKDKRVFFTGHTGFKGSWLTLWLHTLGAKVTGYALEAPTKPSLYDVAGIHKLCTSVIADIRDRETLENALTGAKPDIVIHMAAQPLVRESYKNPTETYEINVMGTVNLLEAVRKCDSVRAVVNVTTDKCYENKEWVWGYRETDRLGGHDPYSTSKACSEMVTSSYWQSFYNSRPDVKHKMGIGTARAGNVIGGGDWAVDRLVPDILRALSLKENVLIRNPQAIRPWQYVLEPLSGYLLLAQKLYENGPGYSGGWNFGPDDNDAKSVEWIVRRLCRKLGSGINYVIDSAYRPHEAHYLKLDCSKAKARLGWRPKWKLDQALDKVVEWNDAYHAGKNMQDICLKQIAEYVMEKPEAQD